MKGNKKVMHKDYKYQTFADSLPDKGGYWEVSGMANSNVRSEDCAIKR